MATMSVQIPVEDTLWNEATAAFQNQGTNIFEAIRTFLKKSVSEETQASAHSGNKRAFQDVWAELCREFDSSDMTADEINDEIDLCRSERRAKENNFPMPGTIHFGYGYIISAPKDCPASWLSDFHELYDNKASAALEAINHISDTAERTGLAMLSPEEINAEIAVCRKGR